MRVFHVNAFTDRPFSGNPAAVFLLDSPLSDSHMQQLATEMNHSESAFYLPGAKYSLRWFTPVEEVDLCGHATLATSHILFQEGLADKTVSYETRSGGITVVQDYENLIMDFPADYEEEVVAPEILLEAMGVDPLYTGKGRFDYLIMLEHSSQVRQCHPDMNMLRAVDARGVVITAPGCDEVNDFVSRFFAPAVGVPEDPVTGSAHCMLGPFWAARLGTQDMKAAQLSPRGGSLGVKVRHDRVYLEGRAFTMFEVKEESAICQLFDE